VNDCALRRGIVQPLSFFCFLFQIIYCRVAGMSCTLCGGSALLAACSNPPIARVSWCLVFRGSVGACLSFLFVGLYSRCRVGFEPKARFSPTAGVCKAVDFRVCLWDFPSQVWCTSLNPVMTEAGRREGDRDKRWKGEKRRTDLRKPHAGDVKDRVRLWVSAVFCCFHSLGKTFVCLGRNPAFVFWYCASV